MYKAFRNAAKYLWKAQLTVSKVVKHINNTISMIAMGSVYNLVSWKKNKRHSMNVKV